MASAFLRSSVGLALRRAAAAAPASSSRLSSASSGGASTGAVRTYYGSHGYGWRSRYDAHAYSHESFFPPSEMDKLDGYFGFAAFVGTMLFVGLMDGDYRFWCRRDTSTRPPRMTSMRGRPGGR